MYFLYAVILGILLCIHIYKQIKSRLSKVNLLYQTVTIKQNRTEQTFYSDLYIYFSQRVYTVYLNNVLKN